MITTDAPKRRPVLGIAIGVSLAVHLLLIFFYYRGDAEALAKLMNLRPAPKPTELVALSDAITLERRTVPRPRPAVKPVPAQPPPRPQTVQQLPQPLPLPPKPLTKPVVPKPELKVPPPKPRTRPKEIAKSAATAAPLTAKAFATGVPAKAPAKVAYKQPDQSSLDTTAAAPDETETRPTKPRLSQAQIASLESQFAKTIAKARAASDPLQNLQKAPPSTVKRYPVDFQGRQGPLRRGEGLLTPLKKWTSGPWVLYYVKYEYVYGDGHVESGYVPWPLRYPANADPFQQPPHSMPLPGPLPDYVLNTEIPADERILRHYFPDRYPDAKDVQG